MLRDERGVVLVLVALMLPVMIGFAGLVIDVGNWFEHKRHLQMQAEAGALAGAAEFGARCGVDNASADVAVKQAAASYSGGDFNAQIGASDPAHILRAFNSPTPPGRSSPVDTSVVESDVCDAKMIDVKLTETDLPFLLKAAQVVPAISAHARVALRNQTVFNGALPIAVENISPVSARAEFIDQGGTLLQSAILERVGTAGGTAVWTNKDGADADTDPDPVDVHMTGAPNSGGHVSVRIVLSGETRPRCNSGLTNCYDDLNYISMWRGTTAASAATPRVRDARLFAASCEDAYFTILAGAYPCSTTLSAQIDFGTGAGSAPVNTTRVYAKRADLAAGAEIAMTPPASAGASWTDGPVGVARGEGKVDVELLYRLGCPTDRTVACTGTGHELKSLGTVQRSFAGSMARSGPITSVQVFEGGAPGANSFESCTAARCHHNLVVQIGIKGSLENATSVSDPAVSLKVADGTALDCDPALTTFADELAQGCNAKYATENLGDPCPASSAALFSTGQPWHCVGVATSASPDDLARGLNRRILGAAAAASCTSPNNWSSFPNFPAGDPRVVKLFLTPFGSSGADPGTTLAVSGSPTFYITGWTGSPGGTANPCQGAGDDSAGPGEIVGHFIKYIDPLNNGGTSDDTCDFTTFGRCVAVLTR